MSEPIKVSTSIVLELPTLPNFIKVAGERDVIMDVKNLSDEALRDIGSAWTEQLVIHAAKRRAAK